MAADSLFSWKNARNAGKDFSKHALPLSVEKPFAVAERAFFPQSPSQYKKYRICRTHPSAPCTLRNCSSKQITDSFFGFSSCFQSNNPGEAYSNISPTSIQPSSLQIPEMSGHFILGGVRFPNPPITKYYSLAALWRIGGFFLRKIWAANSIVLLQVTLIILEKMKKDAPFQIEWWASPLFITSHHFLHDWNLYRNI